MNRGIAAEVNALCLRGVGERTIDHPGLCLSPVFLVPKSSGEFRMILNLKRINLHISPAHFRMETLGSILPLLRPGIGPRPYSALRPQTRTAPVHKTGRVRGGLPQTARPKTVLLSGRLASGGRVPGLTVPTAALSSPDCAGLGLSNKLGEFGALALAAPDLPRSRHRPARQLAQPSPDRVNTIMAAASRLRRRRQAPARSGSNSWGTWPA